MNASSKEDNILTIFAFAFTGKDEIKRLHFGRNFCDVTYCCFEKTADEKCT